MTPRAVFDVAVRVIGLLVIIASLLYLVSALILFFNPHFPRAAPAMHYLITGVAGLLFGWFLLRGAPFIVRIAYGRDKDSDATPKA